MSDGLKLGFGPFAAPDKGVLIVFADEALALGSQSRAIFKPSDDLFARAAASEGFKGKLGAALELVLPTGLSASRLVVIGVGKAADLKPKDFLRLGGVAAGKLTSSSRRGDDLL